MWTKIKNQFINLFEKTDKKAVYTIIWITVVVALYCTFGVHNFFVRVAEKHILSQPKLFYYSYIYHNFMAFFFFFLISIPFVRLFLKQDMKNTGILPNEKKITLIIILGALIIAPLISLIALINKEIISLYPLGGGMVFSNVGFFVLYYISYAAFCFGFEYLFRGLGFIAIQNRYGAAMAIAITTLASSLTLLTLDKRSSEIVFAIAGGIIFGFMAYKSKSIYPSLIFHFLFGFCIDIYIKFLL